MVNFKLVQLKRKKQATWNSSMTSTLGDIDNKTKTTTFQKQKTTQKTKKTRTKKKKNTASAVRKKKQTRPPFSAASKNGEFRGVSPSSGGFVDRSRFFCNSWKLGFSTEQVDKGVEKNM